MPRPCPSLTEAAGSSSAGSPKVWAVILVLASVLPSPKLDPLISLRNPSPCSHLATFTFILTHTHSKLTKSFQILFYSQIDNTMCYYPVIVGIYHFFALLSKQLPPFSFGKSPLHADHSSIAVESKGSPSIQPEGHWEPARDFSSVSPIPSHTLNFEGAMPRFRNSSDIIRGGDRAFER